MLRLNASIDDYVTRNYISTYHTNRKIIFCLNREQDDSIIKLESGDTEFMFIYSKLFGRDFDELIPENYFRYKKNQLPQYVKNQELIDDAYVLEHCDIHKQNIKLLFGNFDSCAWGNALSIAITEALCFFLQVSNSEGKDVYNDYFRSLKTIILFDLDGTLLDGKGELNNSTKKAVDELKRYCDVGINTGSTLSSAVKKIEAYKFDYVMANYSSVIVSSNDVVEFVFENDLVEDLITEIECRQYVFVNIYGKTKTTNDVQKIVFFTTDAEQFAKFTSDACIFVFDGYVEVVPLQAKARGLHYLRKIRQHLNIISVGNDCNDYHMFEDSDYFYPEFPA